MTNTRANIIDVVGRIIIVVGILGSLILGSAFRNISDFGSTYNLGLAIGGIVSSIISGIVFFGFAEIIELLQKNVVNTQKLLELNTPDMDDNE